jgi:site-specific DNA-methyltransferase (adenine-specific)
VSTESFLDNRVVLRLGDCFAVLARMHDGSVDSCVTDPPYALTFMGKHWDTGQVAHDPAFWAEVLRVLKPGAHLVAFGGTRTYHRLACAIEDVGFEIRDQLAWAYGSGFPKSHDVSKGIDQAAGAKPRETGEFKRALIQRNGDRETWEAGAFASHPEETKLVPVTAPATDAARQWQGFGTALKPAWEPIVLARKPLIGTVVENVLKHGTGALNIDGCRVATDWSSDPTARGWQGRHLSHEGGSVSFVDHNKEASQPSPLGRWPANFVHDGSPEVVAMFPDAGGGDLRGQGGGKRPGGFGGVGSDKGDGGPNGALYADSGSAARFFYTAKADSDDRLGSKHPTVKPVDLMQWLVRLITPPGGVILDPFAGTGTTGEAAFREGMRAILIEREEEYQTDIRRRMKLCVAGSDERARESMKEKLKGKPVDHGPLFAGAYGLGGRQ